MKKKKANDKRTAVHIVDKELLQPYNPVVINLIGLGGTGGQVLTALARINQALVTLNHPGLFVRVFDDDTVSRANLARQLFTTAELGLPKAVALINRINRFFGTNWKAITDKYDKQYSQSGENGWATVTIGCVDTVEARQDIAHTLKIIHKNRGDYRGQPLYYIDFGNSRETGQVILSTIGKIKQPNSKQYRTIEQLPMVTDEFGELLSASEVADNTPSCSLAEALTKQDLFINSALANVGASLLWQLFREGMLFNRGFFLNLKDFRTQPLKVA
ncbi:MAG: system ThiF family protein [Mucilaginibacter sp.]|nr:system ThiF family protein [Mucilaginibacter sp.]